MPDDPFHDVTPLGPVLNLAAALIRLATTLISHRHTRAREDRSR
jgi:hypothetical protein